MKKYILIFTIVIGLLSWSYRPKINEPETKPGDNVTIEDGSILITIHKDLKNSVISPAYKEVKSGVCYELSINGVFYRDLPSNFFSPKKVELAEAFAFTIPGRGKNTSYFLSSEEKTVVCPDEDGNMRFSLDYPTLFANFSGELIKTDDGMKRKEYVVTFKESAVKTENPPPVQIARLGTPVSTFFPEAVIRNGEKRVTFDSLLKQASEEIKMPGESVQIDNDGAGSTKNEVKKQGLRKVTIVIRSKE